MALPTADIRLREKATGMTSGTEGIIALQHAAKIGGVSVEKMDKAIGKMCKYVGEAEMA